MRTLWGKARLAVRAVIEQPMNDNVVLGILLFVGAAFCAIWKCLGLPE